VIALEHPRRIGEIKPAMGEGSSALGWVEGDVHGNKRKYIYFPRQDFCMYKK